MKVSIIICLVAFSFVVRVGTVGAAYTPLNGYGYYEAPNSEGALFAYFDPVGSTGSGVFEPFLRFDPDGYNSDAKNKDLEYGTVGGVHTHSIMLSEIPVVNYNGTGYLQFLLDANQSQKSFLDRWLSIDTVVISLQNDPALTGYQDTGSYPGDNDGSQVLFTLNDVILFDSDVYNAGSGDGDLEMLIPTDLIPDNPNPYLVLWTETGLTSSYTFTFEGAWEQAYQGQSITVNTEPSASYEEWGTLTNSTPPPPTAPVPAAVLLTGLGATGISVLRRKKLV